MKMFGFIALGALSATALCFANVVPISKDTPENQEYRVEIALSSIRAAHLTLARIQQLTHDDPDKAADLCGNAVKYLMNAESCLSNEQPN